MDFFTALRDRDPEKTVGLEFLEGLWAEKLALVAVLITIAIVIVSIVWCIRGGDLQTVFTVMGFVLTGAAGKSKPSPLWKEIMYSRLTMNSRGRIGRAILPDNAFELEENGGIRYLAQQRLTSRQADETEQ